LSCSIAAKSKNAAGQKGSTHGTNKSSAGRSYDEGIIKELRVMVQNIDANRGEALAQQGLGDDFYGEITGFTDGFEKDSLDQVRKLKERTELVINNAGEFNAMWKMITEICNAGQILARERKDKAMRADYTMKNLVKKVRIIRKNKEEGEIPTA
jgi:hypothetical protein